MTEVWKDIKDFPGYQVSNLGRVRTHNKVTSSARYPVRHWKDRILKQKIGKDYCCRVSLWKDGVEKTVLVHRLVANAFCGEKMHTTLTVNHKDGNRLNNNFENLEWVTRRENIQYGYEHGQYPQNRQIIEDVKGEYLIFNSMAALCRFLKRSDSYIETRKRKREPLYSKDGKKYNLI